MSRLKNGDVLLAWPLTQHCITAGWTYNNGSAHNALDFRAQIGTPVYAAEDGTVSFTYSWNGIRTSGDTNSYGNVVKIKHANYGGRTLETLYAHLKMVCVKQGQEVKQWQLIGYSGETGNCQGAHLHFEVRWDGKRKNPLNWLNDDFTCANDAVRAHLGTFTSVVPDVVAKPVEPETEPTPEPEPKPSGLQMVTIGPVSAGDANTLKAIAERLQVACSTVEV